MTNRSLAIPTLAALALALAGCGGSSSPGIQPAPSAGLTEAPASTTTTPTTPTNTTSTTATTPTTTTPLPAAFNTKPTVTVPPGPPPTKLKVIDLIKGKGPAATAGSTVTVQYVGVLDKNGKQFDASWNDGGQPVSFPLSGVIPGWTQGIPGMRVGGRRMLIIPASLAYAKASRPASGASNGSGGKDVAIPANSALVFVIDLHGVS
jgi:peptidylprolyl isomerase